MSNKLLYETTPFNDRFRYIIEYIKKKYNLNEKEIGETIGIRGSSINALKKGKSKKASKQTLMMLESEFNISLEYLLDGKGDLLRNGIYPEEDKTENFTSDEPPSNYLSVSNNKFLDLYEKLINEKDRYISILERENKFLKSKVKSLEDEIKNLID